MLRSWQSLRQRYTRDHLAYLKPGTQAFVNVSLDWFEKIIQPNVLGRIKMPVLATFIHTLVDEHFHALSTARRRAKHVAAVINWAHDFGHVGHTTKVARLPASARRDPSRRLPDPPLTDEMIERLLEGRAPEHRFLLQGLLRSGMRISEAGDLHWTQGNFIPHPERDPPMYTVKAEADKDSCDRWLPMTPDFAEILKAVRPEDRKGYVFMPRKKKRTQLKQLVARLGKRVTTPAGKTCTAHDLRRTFLSRWAIEVAPAVLMVLARHKDIATTMRHYVSIDAEAVARKISGKSVYSPIAPDDMREMATETYAEPPKENEAWVKKMMELYGNDKEQA